MNDNHDSSDRAGSAVPVACHLTRADLAMQADRWERLAAGALVNRQETADGLRITFRPESGVQEELRQLVEIENVCCPWASWSVVATAGELALAVSSAGEGISALHGMFTHSEPDQA